MSIAADILGLGNFFSWVLPFLFVLGVVVLVHELGHFLVARWCGIMVEVFSIGFGPELFGFHDRHGTRWRLAAIPLGGYVKFKGDENAASAPGRAKLGGLSREEQRGNFHAAPLAQRAAIVAAGPAANYLLAIVIFAVWFMAVGKVIIEPKIERIEAGSAAERAGLQPGDKILAVDGAAIASFDDMQRIVMLSAGSELDLLIERGGKRIALKATPEFKETKDQFGNTVKIGLLGVGRTTKKEDVTLQRYDPLSASWLSLKETWFWTKQPLIFLKELVLGRASADQLGGPIRIAQLSREVASVSIIELIRWIAIISISIGLLNLFPIPVLDGGHLLFYGIEAILGRPLSETSQEIGFRIGFALVLMLIIFVTWNDVIHLFGRIGKG